MKRDLSDRAALRQPRGDANDDGAQLNFGSLAEGLGYALRRAQLASFKSFQQVFGESGITPAQYSALLIIELNPGLRQNQVSDALGIKRANFVGLIDKLEKRGLVVRTTAADRRSYALHLTVAGRKFMTELHVLNTLHEQRLRAALSPQQQAQLLDGLNAIVASVDESSARNGAADDEV
jgi:DNA-binding MarR family transcriptional regulator